jgi:hypothetical protein
MTELFTPDAPVRAGSRRTKLTVGAGAACLLVLGGLLLLVCACLQAMRSANKQNAGARLNDCVLQPHQRTSLKDDEGPVVGMQRWLCASIRYDGRPSFETLIDTPDKVDPTGSIVVVPNPEAGLTQRWQTPAEGLLGFLALIYGSVAVMRLGRIKLVIERSSADHE